MRNTILKNRPCQQRQPEYRRILQTGDDAGEFLLSVVLAYIHRSSSLPFQQQQQPESALHGQQTMSVTISPIQRLASRSLQRDIRRLRECETYIKRQRWYICNTLPSVSSEWKRRPPAAATLRRMTALVSALEKRGKSTLEVRGPAVDRACS